MKTLYYAAAACAVFLFAGVSSIRSQPQTQAQTIGGYTFITGGSGPQVCLGRWVPSGDVAIPGVCEGQLVDPSQLTALSARQTSDKLDQLLRVMASIDQRLAVSNDQVRRLIEMSANAPVSGRRTGALLRDAIEGRFDAVPPALLANAAVRKELERLRKDILDDVERAE